MIEYLHGSNLLPEKQSAYRKCHSTETVLLDILSDVSSAADSGQVTLLGLLDQSSAFDVIDHLILLERLRHDFGFSGQVLNWVRSYLTGRSQRVYFNGVSSSVTLLMCGVPQGSVLGPLLFILYTAEIPSIVESFGFHAHSYADDLQIYAHSDPKEAYTLVASFSDCVDAIKEWMASNRLRLNPDKTEVIWLGSPRRLHHCPMTPMIISGATIKPSIKVRNLGVTLDTNLSMTSHVNKLISMCFFHIRQLRLVRRSLTVDTAHALVRSMIHSRLDYCNGVLAGSSVETIRRLQSVLKSAARLILLLPGHASVTDRMKKQLHWLTFPQRITYKLCVMTYKCLHGLAPDYLARHCIPVGAIEGRLRLRSATTGQLLVPARKTVHIGSRGFSFSAPTSWNGLPGYLQDHSISLAQFKSHLKTVLFKI